MATINDTTREILVEDTNGKPLLWLETDADGVTAIIDTMRWATPFDPTKEHIGDAVRDWMLAVGMQRWLFTVIWSYEDMRPEDWDGRDEWDASDDFRIDSYVSDASLGIEYVFVWATDYDDAQAYLESVMVPGMVLQAKEDAWGIEFVWGTYDDARAHIESFTGRNRPTRRSREKPDTTTGAN